MRERGLLLVVRERDSRPGERGERGCWERREVLLVRSKREGEPLFSGGEGPGEISVREGDLKKERSLQRSREREIS